MRLLLVVLNRSQSQQRGSLRLCQSARVEDVHALVWSAADQGFERLFRPGVPEHDGAIVAAAGKESAAWAESDASYPAGVAAQGTQARAAFDVPQAHRLIFAATDQQAAIRAEGDPARPAFVSL